jgi:hypothetical protein
MSTFTNSMFESIKDALSKTTETGGGSFRDIIRCEKGKTYTVRLLPNIETPEKTFYKYISHAWESFATGKYINLVSPTTFQERDPIAEYRYYVHRQGTPEEKSKCKSLIRRENWLINVYVESDPTNPENEGKVKMLRYGRQLNKIINDAIHGDDADQFGMKVFDLSESGCSLRIKVEDQGGFPTYVSSKFLMPYDLKVDVDDIYSNLHDLESINTIKSYNELEDMLNEHYHCNTPQPTADSTEEDDDIPFDSAPGSGANDNTPIVNEEDDDPLDDDVVKNLLSGLDADDE